MRVNNYTGLKLNMTNLNTHSQEKGKSKKSRVA